MNHKAVTVSTEFKKNTQKAIFSIIFFIASYFLMLLFALSITVICGFLAYKIVVAKPHTLTVLAGLGLCSIGVLVLIFLIKFLFKRNKTDRSNLLEINEREQPELFAMIRELVAEIGTSFPKKVYLSTEVNAAVFYDSNFWSMFLPIKKNLQIGVGLINGVTKEELKAILAHEFGHFSQRTMKVGSYVYNMNKIIYNMLYENDSYSNTVSSWASANYIFNLFAKVAIGIVTVIQELLKKIYTILNKNYMALSREMEYHADEIAASVTGFEPLKTGLLRMGFLDTSFDNTIQFYNLKIQENKRSKNFYKDQWQVLKELIKENSLILEHGFPKITLEEQSKYDKSKLVVKDQWASHPTLEERIAKLEATGYLNEKSDNAPANSLFHNIESIQELVTDIIFNQITFTDEIQYLDEKLFLKEYLENIQKNAFHPIYNRYYNKKNPTVFSLDEDKRNTELRSVDSLFSDEKNDWIYSSIAMNNDMDTLRYLQKDNSVANTFDYDGVKYNLADIDELLVKIEKEEKELAKKIKENDIAIYHFFRMKEKTINNEPKLKKIYESFFELDNSYEKSLKKLDDVTDSFQFINQTTPFEIIKKNIAEIYPKEQELKNKIKKLLNNNAVKEQIPLDVLNQINIYTENQLAYFDGQKYIEGDLEILNSIINNFPVLLNQEYYFAKKELLEYQVSLLA